MKIETKEYPVTSVADWLAMRKQDVTASEIAALFGVHPYLTQLQVWADKMGMDAKRGDNLAMRRGRIFEPAVAKAVEEEHSWTLKKSETYIRAPKLRLGCTPDYFRVPPIEQGTWEPVDCKFVQPDVYEKQWQGGSPLAWVLQVLVQVYLTGAERGYVAAMVDNYKKDVFIYDVPRNDEAWAKIVAKVAEFWALVESKTMPSPDFSVDLAHLRKLMPPNPKAEPLDLTADNLLPVLLEEREMAKHRIDEANARIEAIEAEVVHKLAGAPEARTGGWRITNKTQTRKEYVVKASTFSVLRFTKLKEA